MGIPPRDLRQFRAQAHQVRRIGYSLESRSDAQLAASARTLTQRIAGGAPVGDVLPEAFANVQESAHRVSATRYSEEQLMAGAALAMGAVVDMKDGEGKDLAAILPAYLHAISGKKVHVAALDDALARRAAARAAKVLGLLSVRVGVVTANSTLANRKMAYACDVTYASYGQLGSDYLRDNLAESIDDYLQRGLHAAIVDEVDTILIDECRQPYSITVDGGKNANRYRALADLAAELRPDKHYETGQRSSRVSLTANGISRAEAVLGAGDLGSPAQSALLHSLENAIWVKEHCRRGEHYDVTSGRIVMGRQHAYMGRDPRQVPGLRQAIEARDRLSITAEKVTLARVLVRDYFRMYESLAGMSATAALAAKEFADVYGLAVTRIPRCAPSRRIIHGDIIFRSSRRRLDALVQETLSRRGAGQPVVIGVSSREAQQQIAWQLGEAGIAHAMLRVGDKHVASVMERAGRPGAVTVLGESAGRGHDIRLGGEGGSASAREQVIRGGGLAVLSVGRSRSRRTDAWLEALAGLDGEPGESRFFCSLEDPVFIALKSRLARYLRSPFVSSRFETLLVESAQRRFEASAAKRRQGMRPVEEAFDGQRRQIYAERRAILKAADLRAQLRHLAGYPGPVTGPSWNPSRRAVLRIIDDCWQRHIADVDALLDRIVLDQDVRADPVADFQREVRDLYVSMLGRMRTELAALVAT
jgi:preprotein translocase subunit SecA